MSVSPEESKRYVFPQVMRHFLTPCNNTQIARHFSRRLCILYHLSTGLVACVRGDDSARVDSAGGVQGGDGDSALS